MAAANSRSLLLYNDFTTSGATPAAAATDFIVVLAYPREANAKRAACRTAFAASCLLGTGYRDPPVLGWLAT